MADFDLIREEGDGWARRLTVRLREHDWKAEAGSKVSMEVIENAVIPPDERV